MPSRRKTGKNAPILSHEFMITNHGDIVSCVCMIFMVGLMFQVKISWFSRQPFCKLIILHCSLLLVIKYPNSFSFITDFQATSKVASVFIAPQHNITRTVNGM